MLQPNSVTEAITQQADPSSGETAQVCRSSQDDGGAEGLAPGQVLTQEHDAGEGGDGGDG